MTDFLSPARYMQSDDILFLQRHRMAGYALLARVPEQKWESHFQYKNSFDHLLLSVNIDAVIFSDSHRIKVVLDATPGSQAL